jgi:DNA repair protein RecO (recombination protein O)
MSRPRNYQTQAIVIKQIKIGEFDKLLTLYTAEFGKLKAIAKGACRPRSKLGGNVEPLTYSSLSIARGRNLDIITQGQIINGFPELKAELWNISCSFYILELVDLFTMENSTNPTLFELLLDTLHQLPKAANKEAVLRYFELHILDCSGYRPQLQKCVRCTAPLKSTTNFFSPREGGILCPLCAEKEYGAYPISATALKTMRLWETCDCDTARRVKLRPALSSELAQILQNYIKYLLQKESKSISWLEELKRSSFDNPPRTH